MARTSLTVVATTSAGVAAGSFAALLTIFAWIVLAAQTGAAAPLLNSVTIAVTSITAGLLAGLAYYWLSTISPSYRKIFTVIILVCLIVSMYVMSNVLGNDDLVRLVLPLLLVKHISILYLLPDWAVS